MVQVSAVGLVNAASSQFSSHDGHADVKQGNGPDGGRHNQCRGGVLFNRALQRDSTQDQADQHAARVPQKHFGWREVVDQKPTKASGQYQRNHQAIGPSSVNETYCSDRQAQHDPGGASHSVHAVDQVQRVNRTHKHDQSDQWSQIAKGQRVSEDGDFANDNSSRQQHGRGDNLSGQLLASTDAVTIIQDTQRDDHSASNEQSRQKLRVMGCGFQEIREPQQCYGYSNDGGQE